MTTFAVLATGPSMSAELAESLRRYRCIAVNDAFRLAPWCEALAANDLKWWTANPDAKSFRGDKYSTSWFPGVSRIDNNDGPIRSNTNSGLLGLHVAIVRGASRVLLFGFDLKGEHYFGRHKELPNTTDDRFFEFRLQFEQYAKGRSCDGIEIYNCTPSSALACFPFLEPERIHELERA